MANEIERIRTTYAAILALQAVKPTMPPETLEALAELVASAERIATREAAMPVTTTSASGEE